MRPTLVAVALAAALLASPGNVAFVDQLLADLSRLWSGSTLDEGCIWDPNGLCGRSRQNSIDAGCGWDPSGLCGDTNQLRLDEGCGWDPDGCPKGS
jgi:hypothetical protein